MTKLRERLAEQGDRRWSARTRLSCISAIDLLVGDHDRVDVPVHVMSNEEIAAAAPWLDDVIAVALQTRLEPGCATRSR